MSRIKNSKNPRDSKNSNVLITGGCGFIGVNLVNYLLRRGFYYIKILDNLSTGTKENLEESLRENGELFSQTQKNKITYNLSKNPDMHILNRAEVDLIVGEIRSYETCLKATQNIDTVVHLAAHPGVIPSIDDPFYDCDVNVKGTLNLLYASVRNNIDKFIFASSNAPLGNQRPPISEETVPNPLSPYGASKLACEGYCSAFHGSYGLKTISLRFSNAYGPYSLYKNSVVAKFMKDGLLKGELTIHGEGHQARDFIYVDDISQAIYLVLKTPPTSNKIWGNPLNLGTGQETSAHGIRISFSSERKGEIKKTYSDITKAKELLGFSPQISIKNGCRLVYRWFMSKNITEVKKACTLSKSNRA
jgi:UDP-glucose 4-epimerase